MLLSRRRVLAGAAAACLAARPSRTPGQEGEEPARLGILLDTAAEMGFLVPQARKELRILNRQLAAAGRPPVTMREIEGASLDRDGPSSLPARRNVLYALQSLYAEADTVLWITALRGEQSSAGLFAVEQLLKAPDPGRPARQLVLRHAWQEQLQAGDAWVTHPPGPETDPLDLKNRPEEWYRLVSEGRGVIQRSWQVPPGGFRSAFAFPHRVTRASYLKQLGMEGGEALFDQGWARDLAARHGLRFSREKEEWLPRMTGRRWLTTATLLPYLDDAGLEARSAAVLEQFCARESIEEDLVRISGGRTGVVFALGYVSKDLKRQRSLRDRPASTWRDQYLADLLRLGAECAANARENSSRTDRIYATERVELAWAGSTPEAPDPVTRRIAHLAREDKVDAIYLFTNGFLGGGEYGTWSLDPNLVALAIRESGTRLYLRVPFEFGPVPLVLTRIALASGGGVFQSRAGDPDWQINLPRPTWPAPAPAPAA